MLRLNIKILVSPFSIKIIEPILRYRNKKDVDHIRRRLVTFFNSNKKEGKFWQPLGRLSFCRAQWTKVTAYPIIWWCVCVVSFYTCDHFHKSYYILITPDLEIQVCCKEQTKRVCCNQQHRRGVIITFYTLAHRRFQWIIHVEVVKRTQR